jgi:hypothetical protein
VYLQPIKTAPQHDSGEALLASTWSYKLRAHSGTKSRTGGTKCRKANVPMSFYKNSLSTSSDIICDHVRRLRSSAAVPACPYGHETSECRPSGSIPPLSLDRRVAEGVKGFRKVFGTISTTSAGISWRGAGRNST